MYRFIIASLLIVFLNDCTTRVGEPTPLKNPSTSIFLKQINLSDSSSISGRVQLSWVGESSNGFVKQFEVLSDTSTCSQSSRYLDQLDWSSTTKSDSAFLFKIPANKQFATISFRVRAVDNNGLKDLSPPCLDVPVRNTPPTIKLDKPYLSNLALTDTVFSVFSLSWFVDDLDGEDNVDSVYVKINDAPWVGFSKSAQLVTFVPTDPENFLKTSCKMLVGTTGKVDPRLIAGINMNMSNKVYVRAKDISNSFSRLDSTNQFYYKRKTSEFLFVDSYRSSNANRTVLVPIFASIYPAGYDLYDMNVNGDLYLPRNWTLTFSEYLKLYKKIFWSTDLSLYEGSLALELGTLSIQNFLNNGGKILVSTTKLPSDINSPIFQFSPFDSISSKPGQARLQNATKIISGSSFEVPFDTLANNTLISGATPGYIKSTANNFFTTTYQQLSNWTGPNSIAAYTRGTNGKPNQIYFSSDIHVLNGNPIALRNMFQRVFTQEFE